MNHLSKPIGLVVSLAAVLTISTAGCADFIANLIQERSGDITVVIINNTPYRAAFTFGTYDSLDRDLPYGPVDFQQRRLEAMTSTSLTTLSCGRNFAIGTAELVQRMRNTEANLGANFDNDAFAVVVNFSSASLDSDAAALPTAGTAEGLEVRLGVDFACGDELIFTFVEDPPGSFSIQFRLLHLDLES